MATALPRFTTWPWSRVIARRPTRLMSSRSCVATTTVVPVDVPAPVRLIASPALPGEGKWQPTGRKALDGQPFLYTTFMRPDPVHTSLVTGLAWMDPKLVRFDLYSGYQEPGGHYVTFAQQVAAAQH